MCSNKHFFITLLFTKLALPEFPRTETFGCVKKSFNILFEQLGCEKLQLLITTLFDVLAEKVVEKKKRLLIVT